MLTSEQKLWRAVLEMAYTDAELPSCDEQARARKYLRADTPHDEENLRLVCEFADLPVDRVIPWARRQYAAAA